MPLWLDSVEKIRLNHVLPHIRGKLLDIGCGYNNLVRLYGSGIGVDVYPWANIQALVSEDTLLPFSNASFDTVTIVAALNHITNRQQALQEVRRILRDDGQLIVTMINPLVGLLAHVIFTHDEKVRGGFRAGERKGLWNSEVETLLCEAGFYVQKVSQFEFGMNKIYLARKIGPA